MSNLIYLSPVPWKSFAQRPHKFVTWFLSKYEGQVLWVEPYPTRFPSLSDINRTSDNPLASDGNLPQGLRIISIPSLPVEPLPGSGFANKFLWHKIIEQAVEFASEGNCTIVIGKPSIFAKQLIDAIPKCKSIYDAMDDFPAFYRGYSKVAMKRREESVVSSVDEVWASSTQLFNKWAKRRDAVKLVFNGLDSKVSQLPLSSTASSARTVFGYIGTVGNWFDWEIVLQLSHVITRDVIRIIGPVHRACPAQLPNNIEIYPPIEHAGAMLKMAEFDVGLIPFLRNELTNSVDPIKYYEYRALKIPIISTNFGEMEYRDEANGVFLLRDDLSLQKQVEAARQHIGPSEFDIDFIGLNSWATRFDTTGL